ncbi:DALR anticodon-binding domain-containing protein, partial [Peribacillus sp. NPDC058002]
VLNAKKDEAGFKENLEALSRVMNIAVKCDKKVTVDPSAFENDQENALYEKYQKVAKHYMESKDENERFEQLVSLQTEIESYFENTMVMAEDEAIRNNRLSLMKEISDLVAGFAAMNKIILT